MFVIYAEAWYVVVVVGEEEETFNGPALEVWCRDDLPVLSGACQLGGQGVVCLDACEMEASQAMGLCLWHYMVRYCPVWRYWPTEEPQLCHLWSSSNVDVES